MGALRVMTLSDAELSHVEAGAARALERMDAEHGGGAGGAADIDAAFAAELGRLLWEPPRGARGRPDE